MSQHKVLKVGLVGLGMMGRHHARVLRSIEGVELVAVADSIGDPHGVAASLPVLNSVAGLIDMGIDMAVCAVPTQFHEDVGLQLAAGGVHTLVEKPIASTVEAGARLVHAFETAGLVGAVGHIERFNPALQSLRHRLNNGDLGDIYQIATRRQGPFPARITDVGVIKDLGSHDIDLTAWLAQSTFASVSARMTTRSGRANEDMVAAVGLLENGIVTSHLVNWLSPIKERITVVTGAKGAFIADTLTADLTFYENGTIPTEWETLSNFRGVTEGNVTRLAISKPEPLKVELEAFRDAVLGRNSEIVTMREGLEVLRVAERLVASAAAADAELLSEASYV